MRFITIVLISFPGCYGKAISSRLLDGKVPTYVDDIDSYEIVKVNEADAKKSQAAFTSTNKWKQNQIPYAFAPNIDALSRVKIESILLQFNTRTCLRFILKTIETDYIEFADDLTDQCWSYIGRIGGKQTVNLGRRCLVLDGVIIHEILHALGIVHEHTRPDRDQYIIVNYLNIRIGQASNFNRYANSEVETDRFAYDYNSVMHYGRKAFSHNALDTIVPKESKASIGQRTGFSECDLTKLNKYYNCPNTDTNAIIRCSDNQPPPLLPEISRSCTGQHYLATRLIFHRAYKANVVGMWSDHFYTTNQVEMQRFIAEEDYISEGNIGMLANDGKTQCTDCLVPLHRMYNEVVVNHFYTTRKFEVDLARLLGYKYEGIEGYCAEKPACGATLPLHRFASLMRIDHLYVTAGEEYEKYLQDLTLGYGYEGIMCYLWPLLSIG